MNYLKKIPKDKLVFPKLEKIILLVSGILLSFILWEVGSVIIHDTINFLGNINIDELFKDYLYRNYGIPKN